MDIAFGWLGQLADFLFSLFPRIIIVNPTQRGVRFKYGRHVSEITPGVRCFWPVVTEVEVYPVVRQTLNLDSQTLCTSDGRVVGVAGVVVYSVPNIIDFVTETHDGENCIRDIALMAISEVVTSNEYVYLQNDNKKVRMELRNRMGASLKRFGVSVKQVQLSDFFPLHLAIANWNPGEGKWTGLA